MAPTSPINLRITEFLSFSELPLIDVRCRSAYRQDHFHGASHFPGTDLIKRMHELPKRTQPLRLIGEEKEIEKAVTELTEKGYDVKATMIWSNEIRDKASLLGVLESGDSTRRLWQPAPVVEYFVQQYKTQMQGKKALDIGCGAGRDAVFLALNGLDVSAVDYLPGALTKLHRLCDTHQVVVNGYHIDLEKSSSGLGAIDSQFDLILVIRYLHRPLLAEIAKKINSGGFLVYQTFMEGCEAFGKPKNPRYLLKPGELASTFESFNIIKDEVEFLLDGRPTNVFIAQKGLST